MFAAIIGLINKLPDPGLLLAVCHSNVIPETAVGWIVVKSKLALLQIVAAAFDKLGVAGVGFIVTVVEELVFEQPIPSVILTV